MLQEIYHEEVPILEKKLGPTKKAIGELRRKQKVIRKQQRRELRIDAKFKLSDETKKEIQQIEVKLQERRKEESDIRKSMGTIHILIVETQEFLIIMFPVISYLLKRRITWVNTNNSLKIYGYFLLFVGFFIQLINSILD